MKDAVVAKVGVEPTRVASTDFESDFEADVDEEDEDSAGIAAPAATKRRNRHEPPPEYVKDTRQLVLDSRWVEPRLPSSMTRSMRKRFARPVTWQNREHPRQLIRRSLPVVVQSIQESPEEYPEDVERPRTRGECVDGPRPCPWVSCKYNLYLDVTRADGIKFNFPDMMPWDMPKRCSCALDIADSGGVTLEKMADLLNLTRQGARRYEQEIMDKHAHRFVRLKEGCEE